MRITIFLLMILMGSSCADLMLEGDPKNDPGTNFELYWQAFDEHYSYFEADKIDWDSVYSYYRPKINSDTPEDLLLRILVEITISLKDPHVNLYTPRGQVGYQRIPDGSPYNILESNSAYLTNFRKGSSQITYADIAGTNYVYMKIHSFKAARSEFEVIDDIINEIADKDGLIIDIRSNGGGNDLNANLIASVFVEHRWPYRRYRYRNGPDHNDFSHWTIDYIDPHKQAHYDKQVVILTNRWVASASEGFVLSMKDLPKVTTVGDTTMGASGNPILRELPNGWLFRLSNWQVTELDGTWIERIGIAPDVPQWISKDDSVANVDTILERGIDVLNQY